VLDENANFGGQPPAGGPYGKDWYCSLQGSQKTDDGAFSAYPITSGERSSKKKLYARELISYIEAKGRLR
jgi:hypothetical protein